MLDLVDDLTDIFRLCTVVMGVLWFSLLPWSLPLIRRMTRSRLMSAMAMCVLVLTGTWGSVEALLDDSPAPGIRAYLATLGVVWAFAAHVLLIRDGLPGHRDYIPPKDADSI